MPKKYMRHCVDINEATAEGEYMNKQQYMDELVRKLDVFGDEIKEEIVSDYEEHFRMGLANGKTEEQICAELGNIDELVDELNKLTGRQPEKKASEENGTANQGGNTTDKAMDEDEVKKAFNDASEQFAKGLGEAMTSMAGFLGNMAATIAKNSGKFASEFNEKATDAASKVSSKASDWGQKFSGKAGDWTVEFKAKAGDAVESIKNKADEFRNNRNENTGDKLNEFASKSSEFAKKAVNDIGDFAKNVADKTKAFAHEVGASYRQSMNSEAGAAASDYEEDEIDSIARDIVNDETGSRSGASTEPAESVIIETDCGNITVTGCSEDDRIKFNYENNGSANQQLAYGFDFRQDGKTIYAIAKKKSGATNFFKSISCPDIQLTIEIPEGLKNLSIRSMSGDIECEDVAVAQLTITSMSGDINLDNCMVKALEANTMSGDIELEDSDASDMALTTVSGDVRVIDGGTESLNAKTTSGDVAIEDCKTYDVNASSVSGDVSVTVEDVGGYLAHVKTTCGDISLEFNGESLDVMRGGSYVLGNGEVKLNLSTVSGDIDVEG